MYALISRIIIIVSVSKPSEMGHLVMCVDMERQSPEFQFDLSSRNYLLQISYLFGC